jgi:hypothetical protein
MAAQSKPAAAPPPTLPLHYRRVLRHLRRMDRRILVDQVLRESLPAWVRQAIEEPDIGDVIVLGLFNMPRRLSEGETIEPTVLVRIDRAHLGKGRPARSAFLQCYWPDGNTLRVSVLEGGRPDWSLFAGSRVGLPSLVNGDEGAHQ